MTVEPPPADEVQVPVGLLDGMATTRAIRRYTDEPIPDDDLAAIVFAASRAPSGSNRQPFRFLVLRDGPRAVAAKALLGEAFRRGWAAKRQADGYVAATESDASSPKARTAATMQHYVDHIEAVPVVVLACLVRYRDPNPEEGASIYPACQNLLLAARALGYGGALTMWHRSVEQPLRDLLEIPDGVAMSACITLGRPAGQHGPVRRRPLADLVFDDGWGDAAPWAVEPPEVRHTLWRRPTNSVGEVSQGDVSPTEIPIVRSIAP
jgi:nitroreductase